VQLCQTLVYLNAVCVEVHRMPNQLVDALHTNTDSARWPYLDRLIDLHDMGLIAPEVWRLVCRLCREYEVELEAMRERPSS
jgi:hypothetical protein